MRRVVKWSLFAGVLFVMGGGQRPSAQIERVETVATLPSAGSTENLCQTADGNWFITALDEHAIWKVDTAGTVTTFATIPSMEAIVGIAPTASNGVIITAFKKPWKRPAPVNTDFSDVESHLMVFDKAGKLLDTIPSPQRTAMNGIVSIGGGNYLISDSNPGSVWKYEMASKKLSLWLKDPVLAPGEGTGSGVNGIKVHAGWVYLGVSPTETFYKVEIGSDGKPKGAVVKWASGVRPDDFDFDKNGNLYGSNARFPFVYKITPQGKVSKLLEMVPGGAGSFVGKDGKLYWVTRGGTVPSRLLRTSIP